MEKAMPNGLLTQTHEFSLIWPRHTAVRVDVEAALKARPLPVAHEREIVNKPFAEDVL